MEDFFTQFRKNWQSRPAPEVNENDWLELRKRLDGQRRKRRLLPLAGWLVLPVLLGSIGFNWVGFTALQQARQRISELETRRDTVTLTRTIYRTDTVFLLRFQRLASPSQSVVSSGTVIAGDFRSQEDRPAFVGPANSAERAFSPPASGFSAWSNLPQTNLLPPDLPDLLHAGPPSFEFALLPIVAPKHRKNLRHYLYDLRPGGVSLGVSGGLALAVEPGLYSTGGWSAGISGAVDFGKNWRLWAEASHLRTHFLVRSLDADIGVLPPDPPADDFIFDEADISQAALQFSAGVDRAFRLPVQRIEPFAGLGIGAVQALPAELSYDFVRQADGVEWTLDRVYAGDRLRFGFGQARLGAGFPFSKRWRFELLSNYRFRWKKDGAGAPGVWSLQLGIRREL